MLRLIVYQNESNFTSFSLQLGREYWIIMPVCKLESSQEQDTRPAAPGILLTLQTIKHARTLINGFLEMFLKMN